MNTSVIHIRNPQKTCIVSERESGVRAALQSLFHRRKIMIHAVNGISFDVTPGEIVGFLGPNGAGKTTTFKMLSGLLYPTAGEATVLGHVPSKRERDFLRQISFVMGQRNELYWDIPPLDTFELNRVIYRIPAADYRRMLDELTIPREKRAVMTQLFCAHVEEPGISRFCLVRGRFSRDMSALPPHFMKRERCACFRT